MRYEVLICFCPLFTQCMAIWMLNSRWVFILSISKDSKFQMPSWQKRVVPVTSLLTGLPSLVQLALPLVWLTLSLECSSLESHSYDQIAHPFTCITPFLLGLCLHWPASMMLTWLPVAWLASQISAFSKGQAHISVPPWAFLDHLSLNS